MRRSRRAAQILMMAVPFALAACTTQPSASVVLQTTSSGAAASSPAAAGSSVAGPSVAASSVGGSSVGGSSVASSSVAGSPSWRARTLLSLSPGVVAVAVSAPANAAYTLSVKSPGKGPYRLRRIGLSSKSVTTGPAFPVAGLSIAGGYLWVPGAIPGGHSTFRLVLYQVNPATLRVVRSWRLTGETAGFGAVAVAAGPAGTVWVGFERTLRRLRTSTGAVLASARLRSGLSVTDVAVDPAGRRLYVSAEPSRGGAVLREYSANSGRLLVSRTAKPLTFSVAGAELTGVPGGVWASFRTGMAGQTILLRRRDLRAVRLTGGKGLFNWFMGGSTSYAGGSLWLGTDGGAIGCIAPGTGKARSPGTLKALSGTGELLAASSSRREVLALGPSAILRITAPAGCWR